MTSHIPNQSRNSPLRMFRRLGVNYEVLITTTWKLDVFHQNFSDGTVGMLHVRSIESCPTFAERLAPGLRQQRKAKESWAVDATRMHRLGGQFAAVGPLVLLDSWVNGRSTKLWLRTQKSQAPAISQLKCRRFTMVRVYPNMDPPTTNKQYKNHVEHDWCLQSTNDSSQLPREVRGGTLHHYQSLLRPAISHDTPLLSTTYIII